MPRRVPRKPRPKKTGVPKGYDSIWEYEIHQTLLKDWKHHWDNIDYIVKHKYEPDFVKIIDNKTILIELEDEGWKFTCDKYNINIDSGLYFGNKNSYIQNKNIFISGITSIKNENIIWQLGKI